MRKNILLMIFVLALFTVISTGDRAHAEGDWLGQKPEEMPDISLSAAFMTKYIWRGWNLGDEPVMQLDASLAKWGFTLDWWANYSFNNDKTKDGGRYQEFTEIDYTIEYTFNVGEASDALGFEAPEVLDPLSISVGYIYYTFPNVDWDDKFFDTHEIYVGAAYDCLLQPSFTWYLDVDDGSGSYFLFGIGHTFEFGDSGITADVGMTTGIIAEQWTSETGFADMVFSGSVNIPVLEHFTVTPSVNYSLILDRDTYEDAAENEFYGGVTISFEY